MASINSVSSNNLTSSLYNSANVISGLASGLDTESMIEGLVQSYQKKIQELSNKATKLTWKQEAYRTIISRMNAFSNKYTSYTSATNLMSASFFKSAVKVAALGKYADKVTASGRSDSAIKLNKVTQLATAARYTTKGNMNVGDGFDITAASGVKFDDTVERGTLSGSLSFSYGGKTISVTFDPSKDMIDNSLSAVEKAEALADMIRSKLADEQVTLSNGETRAASDLIDVKTTYGGITFQDKTTGGNEVYISSASGTVESVLGLDLSNADKDKPKTIQVKDSTKFTQYPTVANQISGKTMNISLDGKSKTIYLPRVVSKGDGSYIIYKATKSTDASGNASVSYTGGKEVSADEYADYYTELVQDAISQEFGSKIKVTNLGEQITDENGNTMDEDGNSYGKSLKLSFEAPENSTMIINSDAGIALGIGRTATNYVNTGKTLGELSDINWWNMNLARDSSGNLLTDKNGDYLFEFVLNGKVVGAYNENSTLADLMSDINKSDAGVTVSYSQTTKTFAFTSKETGSESGITFGRNGRRKDNDLALALFSSAGSLGNTFSDVYGLDLEEGESKKVTFSIGGDMPLSKSFTVESGETMEDIAERLNKTLQAFGHTATYNNASGQIIVTDSTTGKQVDLEVSVDEQKLEPQFTSNYTSGQDAVFQVEVNGQKLDMIRSDNSVSIDGMTIGFKSTFEAEEGDEVTFQVTTDSDKIVDAVKAMIEDYNAMMAEIRKQYGTMPYQDSNGSFKSYEPLSDEDKATMSESAIQAYEEKAKQGLLFNDYDLSTLYDRMREVFAPTGADAALLQKMGIAMSYTSTDNVPYLTLDESKFREMLENDPDTVTDLFTRSVDTGAQSNGLMQGLKVQLDRYAGLTGATKGILVERAGTPLSSLSLLNNTWQKQIDNIYTDIEKWQDKLSAQVDRYTSLFSKLETLIYQMNSQSSTFAGLMGGVGGY